MYCGSAFWLKDMSHVPDVRPAALATDIVTTPLPLFESTMLPEKTVGVGPGTNGNSGATGELLQPITVKLADEAKHIQTYAIPDLVDVACDLSVATRSEADADASFALVDMVPPSDLCQNPIVASTAHCGLCGQRSGEIQPVESPIWFSLCPAETRNNLRIEPVAGDRSSFDCLAATEVIRTLVGCGCGARKTGGPIKLIRGLLAMKNPAVQELPPM
jgi:hypothetical protein